jgi:hypothetical protein
MWNSEKIKTFYQRHQGKVKVLAAGAVIFILAFYGICYLASLKAAEIFNLVMAKQQVLQGSLTVERLSANLFGQVSFDGLVWQGPDGQEIANIPSGKFKVKPWDVVTQNLSTTSITYLELNEATVLLQFDNQMKLVNVDRSIKSLKVGQLNEEKGRWLEQGSWPDLQTRVALAAEANPASEGDAAKDGGAAQDQDKFAQQKKEQAARQEAAIKRRREEMKTDKLVRNKEMKGTIVLNNCTVHGVAPKRDFLMNEVNARLELDTTKALKIAFSCGPFGGTVDADGMNLTGKIDLTKPIPEYALSLNIANCNPSSLGSGINVKDEVSADANITGLLPEPIIEGALHMATLDIPALHFTNVEGLFHYSNGIISAHDVTASVYGGKVAASGYFNLNNKHYNLDCKGHELMGSIAAKDMKLKCKVELDLHMRSSGNAKKTLTYGSFTSGKGSYYFVPFNKISGKFSNLYKTLSFSDVVISTAVGDVKSDAFKIVDGKLQLGKIYLESPAMKGRWDLR